MRAIVIAVSAMLVLGGAGIRAAESAAPDGAALDQRFQGTVKPFLEAYCVSCHSADKPKGDFDLTPYSNLESVTRELPRWQLLAERLEAGEMPPKERKKQPSREARREVIDWAKSARKFEAKRHVGDPGIVTARRLSNAEYDYTVRDLTGIDIRPTKEFPVDPANEAGFDNTGESLTMSPALVKKYLEAAERVASHLVMTPDGFAFAPHPAVTDTDRDKYCVNRIVAFYKRQPTDYADYFLAAWRHKHRANADATLAEAAAELNVSARYLQTIWDTLEGEAQDVGPVAALQAMWRELPDDPSKQNEAKAGCGRMRDFVVALRAKLVPRVPNLTAPRMNNGSQPLVLWKDRKMAENRRRYEGGALKVGDVGLPEDSAAAKAMTVPGDEDKAKRYEATFERFCSKFPDAFYISERARVFLDPEKEKADGNVGRLLSAGFHSQMGYFRDDQPLYDLVLDDAQRRELDRLWQELDFVASAPIRQYQGLIWFDRTDSTFMRDREFDFARAEDKDCASQAKVDKLAGLYTAKAKRLGASDEALGAIGQYFRDMGATFRRLDAEHAAAEPLHLAALKSFTERAYRRPLTSAEKDELVAFYRSLRTDDGLTHEEAIRDSVVRVLLSPHFCYRLDLPRSTGGDSTLSAIRPLDDVALASRLSYFLWSSMPDRELLDLAAAGQLHRTEVLVAQAKRMLKDDRARNFAVEFAGNWLDFRRFEEHNGVDRGRFPQFTNELRQAMFDEPVRFFLDVVRRDGSVLDFLYADHTFVNAGLARHYGMPMPQTAGADGWARIDGTGQYGRGGLLAMGVFLTNNSPGLRTSPVKRGNWVVKRILGERIPPPPPTVPELPADESKLGELTLRETLARHRADPSCAACHERFDSLGLVFEGYGPVGERRDKDLGERAVDSTAAFPGGSEGAGLEGLRTYIRQHREHDFLDNLCRKLLAYGLGRSLLASDDDTVEAMRAKLATDGGRFGSMIEVIVTSPQFLNKRVGTELTTTASEGVKSR